MNGIQHSQIGRAGVDFLSGDAHLYWLGQRELLTESSNFPDLFWSGENADPEYRKKYPEWRDYIMIPVNGKKLNCHAAFDPLELWNTYPPVVHHLLTETLKSMKQDDPARAAKFAGPLSHLIGDTGQAAHIIDPRAVVPLFRKEEECYLMHTYLENIPGVHCAEHAHKPECLAADAAKLEWHFIQRLARLKRRSLLTVVPIMNALEAGKTEDAEKIASDTVGQCADLLSDLLHSLWCIHSGKTKEAPVKYALQKLEFSGFCCDGMFNYMPQIDHIPGKQKNKPLSLDLGNGPEKGIALLPWLYPGYPGIRRAFAEYLLPENGFAALEFSCGLNRSAEKNETSAIFEVLLNGKLIWESPALSVTSDPFFARIPLKTGKVLRLQVRDARNETESAPTRFFYPAFVSPVLIV